MYLIEIIFFAILILLYYKEIMLPIKSLKQKLWRK